MNVEVVRYEAPPAAIALAETLVGTLLLPVLGMIFHRQDPLFLQSDFSWLIFPPLLFGIRYGFVYGFSSSLLTAALMVLDWRCAAGAPVVYPVQYALSVVLVGMLAGQFTDTWLRRLRRAQESGDQASERLDSFQRSYQLLKVSHDQLEERLAADAHNPRAALAALHRQFASYHDVDLLNHHAADILEFLAVQGQIQQASLFAVTGNRRLEETPLASLGAPVPCPADHPMLRMCLERRELVSLRSGDTRLLERQERQKLLAVVPLADVRGHIWAVVVIAAMPFSTYHNRALNLIGVLAANLGDLISRVTHRGESAHDSDSAENFRNELVLWDDYARRYEVDATLVGMWLAAGINSGRSGERTDEWLLEQLRPADVALCSPNAQGGNSLLILMPMTGEAAAVEYREHVLRSLEEHLGKPVDGSQVLFHLRRVGTDGEPAALFTSLCGECGIARA